MVNLSFAHNQQITEAEKGNVSRFAIRIFVNLSANILDFVGPAYIRLNLPREGVHAPAVQCMLAL